MRTLKVLGPVITTLFLAVTAVGCAATEAGDDATTASNIQPFVDTLGGLGRGNWAYSFAVVRADGTRKVLVSKNADASKMGASTFKLFTGWTAFKRRTMDQDTLSNMLHHSNNGQADEAMRANGGTAANRKWLTGNGVALSNKFHQYDGSGLDNSSRLTANDLMALLTRIKADPEYKTFRGLLARPDESSTLSGRFDSLSGRIFAKTGTYPNSQVKALAGFAVLPDGENTLLFAVVGSGVGDSGSAYDRVEDVVRNAVAHAGDYVAPTEVGRVDNDPKSDDDVPRGPEGYSDSPL